MAISSDIFGRLDALTSKIKALCCSITKYLPLTGGTLNGKLTIVNIIAEGNSSSALLIDGNGNDQINISGQNDLNIICDGGYVMQAVDESGFPIIKINGNGNGNKLGTIISHTLNAAASGDVLVGLDIAPTFVGGIATVNISAGGTLYTTGTYTNVPLIEEDNGAGAIATIVVAGGLVTTVTITTAGSGYYLGNILTADSANIGNSGSGFTVIVASLATNVSAYGARIDGSILNTIGNTSLYTSNIINSTLTLHTQTPTVSNFFLRADGTNVFLNAASSFGNIFFRVGNVNYGQLMTSGNLILQNGGTFTDNGDRLQVSGNINLKTAGNKLKIATGSNASAGTVTLSGATTTVGTTAVTATSIILLTTQSVGGTAGFLVVSAKSTGASFTITSSQGALDTSVVGWIIIN